MERVAMRGIASKKNTVSLVLILIPLLIGSCGSGDSVKTTDCSKRTVDMKDMKTLRIKWERLVSDGQTCQRCGSTEEELEKAVSTLRRSLDPMGIDVVLEKHELSKEEFEKNPLQSNQIWLNDRSLEDWIDGTAGQSPCCDVCGPLDCRTVEVEGKVYETITADLITKAGLIAASQLVGTEVNEPCSGPCEAPGASDTGCCPK
jgi:hypothetical protein